MEKLCNCSARAQEPVDISGDDFGCAAVDRLVEAADAFRRFEIELDRVRARPTSLKYEAGGRVNRAACADGDEKIAAAQSLVDALHVVRHFAWRREAIVPGGHCRTAAASG